MTLFTQFKKITSYIIHKIYLKTAQNCNIRGIYNKTAYVQS